MCRTQEIASYVGLTAEQSNQPCLFNRKNVSVLVVLSLTTASSLIYLLHDANTFIEYTHAFAAFSSMLVATVIFAIVIWKMKPFFDCLSMMENKAVFPS